MAKIYLIRHGQASFGADDYDKLSELGSRQSELLGRFFDQIGLSFDAVFTGGLKRQGQTAEITLSLIPSNRAKPVSMACFNEYDAAAIIRRHFPKMLSEDPTYQDDMDRLFTDPVSFRRIFDTAMSRWFQGLEEDENIETWEQVRTRVVEGLLEIGGQTDANGKIAVFTSGGAISAALQSSLQFSNDQARKVILRTANSSFSLFESHTDRLTLISYNNICHLQVADEKGLITYY
jgi:broad specificity phosphatase PhoE